MIENIYATTDLPNFQKVFISKSQNSTIEVLNLKMAPIDSFCSSSFTTILCLIEELYTYLQDK